MKNHLSALWRKLFYSPYFFTIALRKRADSSILSDPSFAADYVIPATYRKWAADPILVDHEDKTYLFYEAVHNEKGRIEVVSIDAECRPSEPVVILEDACHYSYPFVFKHQNEWYMIPESSASEEVRLYKATAFPYKWELSTVLLRQKSVDTTVFLHNGTQYLLTYLITAGSECVIPQAYRMDWEGEIPTLELIPWDVYNGLTCRGAGPVFEIDNRGIRPAQINKDQQYGNAVVFYEINVQNSKYQESEIVRLSPESVKAKSFYLDGLHTYTQSAKFEAIDIRCREFEAGKLLRVIKNKLCK